MAKGVINLQKESGGVTKITSTDGTGITELVLPESGELVNKDYADLKVALTSFTGTNVNFNANGYQKLPSGLIIQWMISNFNRNQAYNFPIAFPNSCFVVLTTHYGGDSSATPGSYDITPSQFKLNWSLAASPLNQQVFAIGY